MSCASHSGQETHGGNGFAAEFFSVFDSFLHNRHTASCLANLSDHETYVPMIILRHELQVRSEANLQLNGETVGAINFPQRRPRLLLLSEEKWKNSNAEQKQALVIHEILHLVGFNDKNYDYSSQMINCLKEWQLQFKPTSQVKSILAACDQNEIPILTRTELVSAFGTEDSFLSRFYSAVLIANQCVAGIKRMKEEILFECGPFCKARACEIADNAFPSTDPLTKENRNLRFLETLLTDFKTDVEMSSCAWKICESISVFGHSQYPRVLEICLSRM